MSLATRCPACRTEFRVVHDQLKVSGGWVRCGHCHEVFNALEALFELPESAYEARSPAPPRAPVRPPAPAPTSSPSSSRTSTRAPDPRVEPRAEPRISTQTSQRTRPAPVAAPEPASDEGPASTWGVSRAGEVLVRAPGPVRPNATSPAPTPSARKPGPAPSPKTASTANATTATEGDDPRRDPSWDLDSNDLLGDDSRGGRDSSLSQLTLSGVTHSPTLTGQTTLLRGVVPGDGFPAPPPALAAMPPASDQPRFLREAQRQAVWRKPAVRAGLGLAALLLALGLLAQVGLRQHDEIAARWPWTQPALSSLCRLADCLLAPPLVLDGLALDSSQLQQTDNPQVLRLNAEIRNKASFAVRRPALELSLLDAQGNVQVRRILLPKELGTSDEGLAADSVWPIDARLAVGRLRVAGYLVELLYP